MGTFRFFLAFAIAFCHMALEFLPREEVELYLFLGPPMAVNSFFFISGFIIILTLNKNYFTGDSYLKQSSRYYLNRILRIYPLYILSILFFYLDASLLNIINADGHLNTNSYLLDYKFILSNIFLIFQSSYFEVGLVNTVAWSLDLELQWYLFAPVLYYFFYYKYNAVYLRIGMYLLILIYTYLLILLHLEPFFLSSFTYFIWGILMYDIYLIYQSKFNNLIKMKYFLSFSSILIFSYIAFDLDFLWYTYWLGVALLCLTVNFKSRIDKLLGDLSYPVFVLHMSILPIAFLQVNKYCMLLFGISFGDYFMIVFILSFIFFVVFCYMILLVFQYPLDRLRNIIKSDSQIKDVVIKP